MIKIFEITDLDKSVLSSINRLLPQLSKSSKPITVDHLENLVKSDCSQLFAAKEGQEIIGMLSLVVFLIPTGIWLLKPYFEKIPRELEEAAFVDGAGRLYMLGRIILPLSIPGLIVVGVAVFIGAYAQQFLFAITFNQTREYQPLPAGLYEFIGYQTVTWNEMMAAALVGVLPVMFVFLFLQKYLVAGLTAGAVKD